MLHIKFGKEKLSSFEEAKCFNVNERATKHVDGPKHKMKRDSGT